MMAKRMSCTTWRPIRANSDNLWDDMARASLKSDLIADLYDNLPVARTPALEQVALV
jgi:hypothetical protein